MVGKTSISGTKTPLQPEAGPSLGRKRRESFAASKAYDISARQVVAIHTQHREKASPKDRMVAGTPAKVSQGLRRAVPARMVNSAQKKPHFNRKRGQGCRRKPDSLSRWWGSASPAAWCRHRPFGPATQLSSGGHL